MTKQEQYEKILDAVETAIIQAAELSGLRNWMIYHHLKNLKPKEEPNEELIVQSEGNSLIAAFEGIIDPDDREYFESELYENCDTDRDFGGVGNPLASRQLHKALRGAP